MQLRHTDIKQKSLLATNIKVSQLLAENLPPPPQNIDNNFQILDLGAGKGFFTKIIYTILEQKGFTPQKHLKACDCNLKEYAFNEFIPCEFGDFNQGLKYEDDSFYCVISMEVIEHLEDPFKYLRETARIISKGGFLLLTTPNILNLASRVRYFFNGTYQLFGFLPQDPLLFRGCYQHINPLSLVYLSFILKKNNFRLEVTTDRFKKSSLFLYYITKPFFLLAKFQTIKRLQNKEKQLYEENKDIIPLMYSKTILCGRTLIIKAIKH
ncbi:MAG: class I SAM-dependent methyltransferase [Helicobacter apodemus]|nr:class I SAM-dependent methyltransferase [Helicobacter apodemus]